MNDSSVSENEIKRIITDFAPNKKAVKISRINQGFSNLVYLIGLGDSKEIILRILNPEEDDRILEKEKLFYELIQKHAIPSPKILKTDTSQKLIPYSYSISEKVEGKPLSEILEDLNPKEVISIYTQLGHLVGKLHSIKFELFGDLVTKEDNTVAGPAIELDNKGPFDTWMEMFTEIINKRLSLLENTVFNSLIPPLKKYFESNNTLIDYKIIPRLLHMDLHKGNIFINNGSISGIIDVEESLIGHNEYDLMRLEHAHFVDKEDSNYKAFVKAYTSHVELDDGYEERRQFYSLSRHLVQMQCLVKYGESYSENLEEDIKKEIEYAKELFKTAQSS